MEMGIIGISSPPHFAAAVKEILMWGPSSITFSDVNGHIHFAALPQAIDKEEEMDLVVAAL